MGRPLLLRHRAPCAAITSRMDCLHEFSLPALAFSPPIAATRLADDSLQRLDVGAKPFFSRDHCCSLLVPSRLQNDDCHRGARQDRPASIASPCFVRTLAASSLPAPSRPARALLSLLDSPRRWPVWRGVADSQRGGLGRHAFARTPCHATIVARANDTMSW